MAVGTEPASLQTRLRSRVRLHHRWAGSAGCVLANRLSEDSNATVLLIESGGTDSDMGIQVPLANPLLQKSSVDWQYLTAPQEHACQKQVERRSCWPRGKVLGGTSSINAMSYTRGNSHDYDRWEKVYGAEGWSWDQVLPYFIKSEDFQADGDEGYHGHEGPLTVTKTSFVTPAARVFMEAGKEIGYEEVDYNGRKQIGVSYTQKTVRNGRRWSTATAFLHPVRDRPNLFVWTEKSVRRVVLDGGAAVGVEVVDTEDLAEGGAMVEVVTARREVILSAGTIGSTHILMLSGIGPADHLRAAGVEVKKDLPVGKNLQDHIMIMGPIVNRKLSPTSGVAFTRAMLESPWTILQYFMFGTGPLTAAIPEVHGFFQSGLQDSSDPRPDIHMVYSTAKSSPDELNIFCIDAKDYESILREKKYNDDDDVTATFVPGLLHPKSRGEILLNISSGNLYSPPVIDPKYLSHPDDVEVLLKGIRIAEKMFATDSFNILKENDDSQLGDEFETPYKLGTDDFWKFVIRAITLTIYHPVGTCKMGGASVEDRVVDPQLRVVGVKKLRVVDGSVIPEVVSGNTNAPIIMIAERAADLIKQDYV